MKKILLLLALLPFQLSAQEQWSFAESNYKLSSHLGITDNDKFYISFRNRDVEDNLQDYVHMELGYSFNKLEVAYRYAVTHGEPAIYDRNDCSGDRGCIRTNGLGDDIVEERVKFTYALWKHGPLSLKSRMEYRTFNIKDDYWRYRWIMGFDLPLNDEITVWSRIQPRWKVKDDLTIDDWRNQLGLTIGKDIVKFSPFIERYSKGETQALGNQLVFFGFNVGVSF